MKQIIISKRNLFPLLIFVIFFASCNQAAQGNKNEEMKSTATKDTLTATDANAASYNGKTLDLKNIYDSFNLNGAFILYDPQKKEYSIYNKALLNQSATPASTFNILTSLIVLEERLCKDESSIIKWNGYISRNPQANKDISLQYGFQHNIDWLFWELRKKIGNERMQDWLENTKYGNLVLPNEVDSVKITPAGTDSFWVVSSDIRITPAQQLDFMKRFYYGQLPFSARNINIVKNLMYEKDINGYQVYGKRGSYRLTGEHKYIGWYTGFITKGDAVYFFVNYLQTNNLAHPEIVDAQKEIVFKILENKMIPE